MKLCRFRSTAAIDCVAFVIDVYKTNQNEIRTVQYNRVLSILNLKPFNEEEDGLNAKCNSISFGKFHP